MCSIPKPTKVATIARPTGAAIAFAKVRAMRVDVYDEFFYTKERVIPPFSGSDLLDLFHNNYCPLHSYVIDRSQCPTGMLEFVTGLTMEEDYDVLLRICATFLSDFTLIETDIGDYYCKTDGTPCRSAAACRATERARVSCAR